MRIGIAACEAFPTLSESNEYFRKSLIALGAEAPVLLWNRDPLAAFLGCDLVVLRQTWDYQDDPGGFAAWMVRAESLGVRIEAPSSLAIWNNDKRTLTELQAQGISIPQTVAVTSRSYTEPISEIASDKIVLKPAFGGSGIGVSVCDRNRFGEAVSRLRSEVPGRPLIAQEFLPEIAHGEWKITCIGGQAALAIRAVPSAGEFRINSRFRPHIEIADPPEPALAASQKLMNWVGTPLCGRVDGVMRGNEFICTEVELTDPDLHLHYRPEIAAILAEKTLHLAAAAGGMAVAES